MGIKYYTYHVTSHLHADTICKGTPIFSTYLLILSADALLTLQATLKELITALSADTILECTDDRDTDGEELYLL